MEIPDTSEFDYYVLVDGEKVTITSYLHPCKNNGRCQQYQWEEFGYEWKPFWVDENGNTHRDGIPYGTRRVYPWDYPLTDQQKKTLDPSIHGSLTYKCCTLCFHPVNQFAAAEINEKLGFELPSVDELLEINLDLSDLLG